MNEFELDKEIEAAQDGSLQTEELAEEAATKAAAEELIKAAAEDSVCEGDDALHNSEESVDEGINEVKPVKKDTFMNSLYEYMETFACALAVMMVLFLFVFRYVSVDGDSMKHTLHHEDKLIISNLLYTPETGDIVVLNPENNNGKSEPIIKRVIATEGQKVFIDYENWEVYVDGEKLDEPYIEAMRKEYQAIRGKNVRMNYTNVDKYKAEFTVDEGKVFVMGDNRNNSLDSRDAKYGEIAVNRILGRVIVRITPDFGFVD